MEAYIIILILLVLLIVFVLWKPSSIRIINLLPRKNAGISKYKGTVLVIPLFGILFIGSLIIFSKTAVTSALKAIELWLGVVFPSIFPFLVASEILNGTSFINAIGIIFEPIMRPLFNVPGCASYLLALGVTSGYPVGAKATSNMRENKRISKRQGERLLAFCNNSSPLFITGAVATGMLKMPGVGPFLLICHIAASVTVGLTFRFLDKTKNTNLKGNTKVSIYKKFTKELLTENNYNIGTLFGNAVVNSMSTILAIGGFIIFFSVTINLLLESGILNITSNIIYYFLRNTKLSKDVITPILSGFIEITTGLQLICSLENISLSLKLILISIVIGWAGLSVHFQVLNVTKNSDLSIKLYLFGKFIQGCIAGLYTYIGIRIINYLPDSYMTVFNTIHESNTVKWQHYFFSSCKYLLIISISLLAIILVSIIILSVKASLQKLHKKSL
ncbi:MAG TPA: sporulation integral membrane protein YlbJ [Clostridiaceae bacterium]|jgi:sporulation integral membrane protein YlbJ|nr:sporulation integral membrane protein YlbJ [Clostridiaceae bacterium]